MLKLGDGCIGIYYTAFPGGVGGGACGQIILGKPHPTAPLGNLQCVLALDFMLLENRHYVGVLTPDPRCPAVPDASKHSRNGRCMNKQGKALTVRKSIHLFYPSVSQTSLLMKSLSLRSTLILKSLEMSLLGNGHRAVYKWY